MSWKKLGLIGVPDQSQDTQYSHCQLPVADVLNENSVRVYYAGRTKEQVSHVSFLDLQIKKEEIKTINKSLKPVLGPGSIGHFDQFGVYPSCILNHNDKKYLFYIGWIRGYEQPLFYAQIGLALSSDNGLTFQKYSSVPVMGMSEYDPCLVTSPNVIYDEDKFRMTYVSGVKWERQSDGKLKSFYNIKIAESTDLINWKRNGIAAIDFKENESNIARSCVIKEDGKYRMWYSYVHTSVNKYRIGYAEASDFNRWTRKDEMAGISVSSNKEAFDSEMLCYPSVFYLNDRKYMLYNGNNFGEKGFGLAIWE